MQHDLGANREGGWTEDWTRRQLLLRGGTVAGAFTLGALVRAGSARGDSSGLSTEQLAVLGALVSAILVAVGQTGDGTNVGLQSPAAVAQSLGRFDPGSQAFILSELGLIQRAPSSGTFTSLSDSQRESFMRQSLAPLAVRSQPDRVMDRTIQQSYEEYAAAVDAGTVPEGIDGGLQPPVDSDPSESPETTSEKVPVPKLSASEVLASALLDALKLVSTPLPPPLQVPPLPAGVVASLTEQLLAGTPVDQLQDVIDQISASMDTPDEADPRILFPVDVFGYALEAWIPGV